MTGMRLFEGKVIQEVRMDNTNPYKYITEIYFTDNKKLTITSDAEGKRKVNTLVEYEQISNNE